jgi:hypothetical protein
MRATLLDWVLDVTRELGYLRQTFHLTVYFIDKFLSLTLNIEVAHL